MLHGGVEKFSPLIGIRAGQHAAVVIQPLDPQGVMDAVAVFIPAGGIGAAKALEPILGSRQRQVLRL
jgi:hypothetical protein